MRPKKFGATPRVRHCISSRHLFHNERKGLSLYKVTEKGDGRKDTWFEVHAIRIDCEHGQILRRMILATPVYERAWDAVKDEEVVVK